MNNSIKMSGKSLMLVGIILVVFGVLLLLSPAAAGELVVMLVALVLVVTGLAQAFQAFRARNRAEALVSGVAEGCREANTTSATSWPRRACCKNARAPARFGWRESWVPGSPPRI